MVPTQVESLREQLAGSRVHLTERQLVWVAHRLSQQDDLYACAAAGVEPDEVLAWREDPRFSEAVSLALGDKRGSFRELSENLLPLALRTIYDMMANGDQKARANALNRLLEVQALKVQVQRDETSDQMARILERLREPVQIRVLDMEPRP